MIALSKSGGARKSHCGRFKHCLPLLLAAPGDMPFHKPANEKHHEGNREKTMSIDFEIPAEAKAIREKVRQWVHDECIPAEKKLDDSRLQDRARRAAHEGARAGPVVSVHPQGIWRHGPWSARQRAGADGARRELSRRAVDEHAGPGRRHDADAAGARHRVSEGEVPQAAAERRKAHLLSR